ncbi:MAG: thiamine pyrophosphate-dependent enzyme [Candidatus Micrarchaeia archaeon]|jgi:pyruvate ferredoxin oxidoreductase beta subunit
MATEQEQLDEKAAGEYFLHGHRACSGCGPATVMKLALQTLGKDTVVVNATGCMEVVSTQYPESSWKLPYVHSLFENVPSVATGVTHALKALGKNGTVVGIGGDGSTYDIGFGALSGAMERNEDMIYICYDNECYANTGVQRSGATPFGAATTTSPSEVLGKSEWKKSLPFICAAHAIPYVATASVAFVPDLKKKLLKAKEKKGFRLVHVHSPCPLGWRFDPSQTIELARLAVKCGMWNLFEIEDGAFKQNMRFPELSPVGDYLKLQGRFKATTPEQLEKIQSHVQKTQDDLKKLEESGINFQYFL